MITANYTIKIKNKVFELNQQEFDELCREIRKFKPPSREVDWGVVPYKPGWEDPRLAPWFINDRILKIT